MNLHLHFWKNVEKIGDNKYQECRCGDRRIKYIACTIYSDGTIINNPVSAGYQPFDFVWLEDNLLENTE